MMQMEVAVSYEFRDRLLTRVTQYETVEKALGAPGPSE